MMLINYLKKTLFIDSAILNKKPHLEFILVFNRSILLTKKVSSSAVLSFQLSMNESYINL